MGATSAPTSSPKCPRSATPPRHSSHRGSCARRMLLLLRSLALVPSRQRLQQRLGWRAPSHGADSRTANITHPSDTRGQNKSTVTHPSQDASSAQPATWPSTRASRPPDLSTPNPPALVCAHVKSAPRVRAGERAGRARTAHARSGMHTVGMRACVHACAAQTSQAGERAPPAHCRGAPQHRRRRGRRAREAAATGGSWDINHRPVGRHRDGRTRRTLRSGLPSVRSEHRHHSWATHRSQSRAGSDAEAATRSRGAREGGGAAATLA